MGETIKYGVIFTIGAAIGAGVTYGLVKTKYEQIANDEIEEMREYYARKFEENFPKSMTPPEEDVVVAESVKIEDKPNITDYSSIIKKESYGRPDDLEEDKGSIHIIDPEEFGEIEDYDKIDLTYYADGFLVDDEGEVVADLDGTVGWDAIDHIGEYEEDAVHVRNDDNECYYEILAVSENYRDIQEE